MNVHAALISSESDVDSSAAAGLPAEHRLAP